MMKCPVEVGQKWVSMKSRLAGEVIQVEEVDGEWTAKLRMANHRVRWVSCTDHGLFGYRRAT